MARDFVEKEVAPHYADWEKAGRMPREVFEHMGSLGMLGMAIPEQYGGSGIDDYRYNVVLQEEAARALVTLSTVRTQLDVILPYFLHYANDEQRQRWFPGLAAGTLLDRRRDDRTRHGFRPGRRPDHAPCATATSTSSTVPRRSSPAAFRPTWSSWLPARRPIPTTAGAV